MTCCACCRRDLVDIQEGAREYGEIACWSRVPASCARNPLLWPHRRPCTKQCTFVGASFLPLAYAFAISVALTQTSIPWLEVSSFSAGWTWPRVQGSPPVSSNSTNFTQVVDRYLLNGATSTTVCFVPSWRCVDDPPDYQPAPLAQLAPAADLAGLAGVVVPACAAAAGAVALALALHIFLLCPTLHRRTAALPCQQGAASGGNVRARIAAIVLALAAAIAGPAVGLAASDAMLFGPVESAAAASAGSLAPYSGEPAPGRLYSAGDGQGLCVAAVSLASAAIALLAAAACAAPRWFANSRDAWEERERLGGALLPPLPPQGAYAAPQLGQQQFFAAPGSSSVGAGPYPYPVPTGYAAPAIYAAPLPAPPLPAAYAMTGGFAGPAGRAAPGKFAGIAEFAER